MNNRENCGKKTGCKLVKVTHSYCIIKPKNAQLRFHSGFRDFKVCALPWYTLSRLLKRASSENVLLDFEEWRSMNKIYSSATQNENNSRILYSFKRSHCQLDAHWSRSHRRAVSTVMDKCLNKVFHN